jgi:hypothetical protein
VVYELEERPPARVGQIILPGNERTRQNVILRQVRPNPRPVIRDIWFVGNTFVSGTVLRRQVRSSPQVLGLFGGKLNPAMVEDDIGALQTYYRSFGYHDVKIWHNLEWDPDGRTAVLVFLIAEGMRYRIQDAPRPLASVCKDNTGGLAGSIVLNKRNFNVLRPPATIDDFLNGNAWRGIRSLKVPTSSAWPERYILAARREAEAVLKPRTCNGHVLDQTVWNHHFEEGTDRLTAGGLDHLASIARRRPRPDPLVFLQTAQDIPSDPKSEQVRADLDARRTRAVRKFLAAQGGRDVVYRIEVRDPGKPLVP